MLKRFKTVWSEALCVMFFAAISLVYFFPADIDGRRLTQHDNGAADGLGVEINQYRAEHNGATPRWTNSVFGGMPTYQIAPSYDSTRGMSFIEKAYHLWLPDYVFYIFISMLGFYILLRAFDFRRWMAVLGAIVWAFSSYFFIIIAAGHIWKVLTLAYIPPTIAGLVLCYRSRYLLGCAVTALFAALQISSNHVQMTYYFLLPETLIVLAFLADSIRTKTPATWFKATGVVVVAAIIAVMLNASNLYHTYEYAKDTMRGKSELVKPGKTDDQTDSGLERSYITAWSYGIGETWTLLIPDAMGSASIPLSDSPAAMKKADPVLRQSGIYGAFTQYWGDQPGTSGPVYIGALVCMLCILALIILPNNSALKWALVAATIMSILLSWGRNFMGLTDLFIDYVPMYSKFRTVSSILVVAEFTIPLLAMLGLKQFADGVTDPARKAQMLRALTVSSAITVLVCVVFATFPDIMGNFTSGADQATMARYASRGMVPNDAAWQQNVINSFIPMRKAMLTDDAWRSALIILLGTFFLYRIYRGKKRTLLIPNYVYIIAICLIDMWQVNKRYLNDSMFETPSIAQNMQKTDIDNYIISRSGDKRNYRVLNLAVNTFNDNTTSFFYSSVGGYHAAKLRRYQELVEEHIASEIPKIYETLSQAPLDSATLLKGPGYPAYDLKAAGGETMYRVLNMLNTRWFILEGQNNVRFPIENNAAFGNAWFAEDVKWVSGANEEIDALHTENPRHTAIIDRQFEPLLDASQSGAGATDSTATVTQTRLISDEVDYDVSSQKGGLVVFSEIYYPGWTATIDGEPANIVRADYVLRAMYVPAGKHQIHMEFHPQTVKNTETIASITFYILIALLATAIIAGWFRKKNSYE